MNRLKATGIAGVLLLVSLVPSCGREQQLVAITVEPSVETYGATNIPLSQDAGLKVQLRAIGAYIHPPVTKDITSQVTWVSNTPQMVTVTSGGAITATGLACGSTLVSATLKTNTDGNENASGAVITGTMTAAVVCPTM